MSRDANGSAGKIGKKVFSNVAGLMTYAAQCQSSMRGTFKNSPETGKYWAYFVMMKPSRSF
ncbi:hypothetical protein DL897_02090 [Thermoflavimicrobium daqui]|uniref:Uncharacterized protein n=1 Tax=Thermoflavimicrobium daqui TaxID=2137476 RepID=A0A364K992_9BACL|nr:hypothetical protein DL897_02090 [Thermoflavimicrobium daqui]